MISGATAIYGIFGYPVTHTFSPGMHNAAFGKTGIDACYVPFSVRPEHLGDAIKSARAMGIRGLNITVPHKEGVIPFLDELSEEARLIGAVNTVEVKDDRLIGHNTDGRGFLRSLRVDGRLDARGKRFLCIGSGGAARAVGFSLALAGAAGIRFRDIDQRKSTALAEDIRLRTGADAVSIPEESLAVAIEEAACIINATPLGLRPSDPPPVPKGNLLKRHFIYDLVYNPPMTPFLKAAKAAGARRLSGLGMLLYQGVIAFEIWTGRKAPVQAMRSSLLRQIRNRR